MCVGGGEVLVTHIDVKLVELEKNPTETDVSWLEFALLDHGEMLFQLRDDLQVSEAFWFGKEVFR